MSRVVASKLERFCWLHSNYIIASVFLAPSGCSLGRGEFNGSKGNVVLIAVVRIGLGEGKRVESNAFDAN